MLTPITPVGAILIGATSKAATVVFLFTIGELSGSIPAREPDGFGYDIATFRST